MALIQYSKAEYSLMTASLGSKIQGISITNEMPETGKSNVAAMKKFVELYSELEQMMAEYKELLEQDQKAIKKVGSEIEEQDMKLTGIFR